MENLIAPGYLIAAPSLGDPHFAKSVILMAEHNDDGAIGFIVNKESPLTLRMLLRGVEEGLVDAAEASGLGDMPVMLGGPVQRHIAWVLYRRDADEDLDDGAISVGNELVVGASMDTLRAFVRGDRSGPFSVLLGYSGWGGQQLESEISRGSWLPLDLKDELTFDVPTQKCWEEALLRLGLVPGTFFMGRGGAKA